MISAVIIDDEIEGASLLKNLLHHYCKQVNIVGIAGNGIDGLAIILEKKPDILFLDIEMPHLNGFDQLEKIHTIQTQVIFTTAYSQYALKAIKFSALDYLLKPKHATDLMEAVKKAEKVLSEKYQYYDLSEKIDTFLAVMKLHGEESSLMEKPSVTPDRTDIHRLGLTNREIEIVELLVTGQTAAQISASLFRSKSTIDKHVQNIYEKLGVSNRAYGPCILYFSALPSTNHK